MTDFLPIEQLLLHKPPMRLIHRLTAELDDGVRCEVDVSNECIFADARGVPAFVAIEYMAQSIGAYDGLDRSRHGCPPQVGFLVGSRRLTLHCDYFSFGQTLEITSKLVWDGGRLLQFKCGVSDKHSQKVLADATINVYAPNREAGE